MENKRIYGFFGTPSYDLIIYLAGILTNLGKHVLVIDHSKDQDVMSCYVQPAETIEFFHYKGVDYTAEIKISSINALEYNYIFLYRDEMVREEIIYDGILLVSDFKKNNLKKAGEFAREYKEKVQYILRDYCNDKLNKNHILKECLGVEPDSSDYNVIELDYYDYVYRIALTHEYHQGFRHISKNYKQCLLKITEWMADPAEENLYKAYRLAKRGRSDGSSFLE